jgi:hypothetical protein
MRKHLLSYRDDTRVEVEYGIPVTAKTAADLRAVATWPDGLVLNIHIDLDLEHREGGADRPVFIRASAPLSAALVRRGIACALCCA